MNLTIPPNLATLLNYISGPLSFNYLQATNFVPWLFNLDSDENEYPMYNDWFTEFGFDTTIAALNLQDTVIYLLIFIIGLPLTVVLINIPIF